MSVVFQQGNGVAGSVDGTTAINTVFITDGEGGCRSAVDFVEDGVASVAAASEFLQLADDAGFQQRAFRHFYIEVGSYGQPGVCRGSVEACIFRVFFQHGAVAIVVYHGVETELVTAAAKRHLQVVCKSGVVQCLVPPVYVRIVIRIGSCPESL